jgi:eukaryotic-like serine/threonine-protein kinase
MMPGTMIGHYRVADLLGAGGMGELYRGTDTKLRRDVAIKVMPALLARDPEWAGWLNELKTLVR